MESPRQAEREVCVRVYWGRGGGWVERVEEDCLSAVISMNENLIWPLNIYGSKVNWKVKEGWSGRLKREFLWENVWVFSLLPCQEGGVGVGVALLPQVWWQFSKTQPGSRLFSRDTMNRSDFPKGFNSEWGLHTDKKKWHQLCNRGLLLQGPVLPGISILRLLSGGWEGEDIGREGLGGSWSKSYLQVVKGALQCTHS